MPIEYAIESDSGIMLTRMWDTVTNEDLFAHGQNAFSDPALKAPIREIINALEIRQSLIDDVGLRFVAAGVAQHRERFAGQRSVIVIRTDSALQRHLAEMYQQLSHTHDTPNTIHYVYSLADARAWLARDKEIRE